MQIIEPLGSANVEVEGSFIYLGIEFDSNGFDEYGTSGPIMAFEEDGQYYLILTLTDSMFTDFA